MVDLGHEVQFIVQNHLFRPKKTNYKIHLLKYPNGEKQEDSPKIRVDKEKIVSSSRGYKYFGQKEVSAIEHYARQINRILTLEKPSIVFGESTALHELITIDLCKGLNILYLNPSSCRYPPGRFSFYKYDKLVERPIELTLLLLHTQTNIPTYIVFTYKKK